MYTGSAVIILLITAWRQYL